MSQLTLKIKGKNYQFFNNTTLSLKYNAVGSIFSFSGYFDPEDEEQKRLFKPLSFHDIEIFFENRILLTGTALSISTSIEDKKTLATISGYSKPGVLQDCEIPLSLYPLQFDNLTLKEIAERIIKPFGITLIIDSTVTDEANKAFEQIAAEPTQSVKEFLASLCKQRNIVLTHDEKGRLVFTRLNIIKPSIATYIQNIPSTKISLSVNGQALHSSISAQKQATIDSDAAGEETVTNSLISTFRPTVKGQSSGDNNDTISAAKAARGSELQAIKVIIETDRWKWFDGKRLHIIKPNEIIEVQSPDNFIYKLTRFFVESVTLNGDEKSNTAVISCVLPEVFTGEQPKNIFE